MSKSRMSRGSLFFTVFLALFSVSPFGMDSAKAERAKTEHASHEARASLFARYSDTAQDVLLKGLSFVGIRYRMGSSQPENGLDCSGFVQFVYREATGLILPRTARAQAEHGEEIDAADLKPGDLVFFNTMRRTFSHVGIYLGDHYFLHAPSSGGAVRLDSMVNRYWQARYDGARRLLQTDGASPSSNPAADSGGI
ncbi:MAG: C40 family peptidase [Zoogloeaceae bacterium]|jgi:cell wall-associated NlpC family hydrolase|nr:C40 family peptidase [Zoogloeaceae bacterium]